jgi:hypothetical protein
MSRKRPLLRPRRKWKVNNLVCLQEALEKVFSSDFKTTSCPVVIDFLIRHGLISPETGNFSTTKE